MGSQDLASASVSLALAANGAALPSPYLTTAEAAAYLRYRGPSGIRMAVQRGWLRPSGRRGRVLLFRREDLERMLGDRDAPGTPAGDDHAEEFEVSRDRVSTRRAEAHPAPRRGPKD